MKTNTENNTQTSNAPIALDPGATVPSRSTGPAWLKLVVLSAAIVASSVTYQAAVEAVELNRAIESCHKALSSEQTSRSTISEQANIFETNLPVAGL